MKLLQLLLALAALGECLFTPDLHAQHGVIREYAALAPEPDAVPLAPLLDAPLTDASITLGPDKAFYLTGSAVEGGGAAFSSRIPIWRSADLKQWAKIRTLDFGASQFRSPEVHFLDSAFWLTLGRKGGGTELVKFDSTDLATSAFKKAAITARGEDPSLFRDEDGTLYWTTGGGEIARLKANPLDGLASEPAKVDVRIAGPPALVRQMHVTNLHGAFLTKIQGKYHLLVTGRLKRLGLGRTGLPKGVNDVLVGASEKPDAGYSPFYVAFPYAGQTTLFRDGNDALWATFSGADERAMFRGRPGAFRVEQVPATQPRWPIGFAGEDPPTRFPFGLMLRPDTSFIYERGMGAARLFPLSRSPQALQPELPDVLQHAESRLRLRSLGLPEQALVHERANRIQGARPAFHLPGAYLLGPLQREAAHEHCQPSEEWPLLGLQEVIAPGDGLPQGLVAGRPVPRPTLEEVQPAPEPLQDRVRGEELDPGRRQLDGQR